MHASVRGGPSGVDVAVDQELEVCSDTEDELVWSATSTASPVPAAANNPISSKRRKVFIGHP
jgi:hypothetical protein